MCMFVPPALGPYSGGEEYVRPTYSVLCRIILEQAAGRVDRQTDRQTHHGICGDVGAITKGLQGKMLTGLSDDCTSSGGA